MQIFVVSGQLLSLRGVPFNCDWLEIILLPYLSTEAYLPQAALFLPAFQFTFSNKSNPTISIPKPFMLYLYVHVLKALACLSVFTLHLLAKVFPTSLTRISASHFFLSNQIRTLIDKHHS